MNFLNNSMGNLSQPRRDISKTHFLRCTTDGNPDVSTVRSIGVQTTVDTEQSKKGSDSMGRWGEGELNKSRGVNTGRKILIITNN